MLTFEVSSFSTGILCKSTSLIKLRLLLYALSFVHLVAISSVLLSIDFSLFDDPNIKLYQKIRFKLITAWFNLLNYGYFPICLYCDWRELKGEHRRPHVKLLNQVRHLCFTSVLLPVTAFGDILFWRVWNTRQELIAPPSIHTVVPFWTQHSMHTVSLVVVLLDLVFVRRKRPKSDALNIFLLCCFLLAYVITCMQSYLNGIYVYPALELFSGFKAVLLFIYSFIEILFYYTSQWLIVDMVWGHENPKKII